ncbi:tafazzin-like isoform X1 [Pomacea canaliculata]|nr:tafazzin-like isoform X1 [Pomacea canaliculata]
MTEHIKIYRDSWQFLPSRSSRKWSLCSRIIVQAVGLSSKIWMEWLNRTKVYNKNILHEAIASRPQNRGLVTVSNHTSCIDDPLLWGTLKLRYLLNPCCMRWTPAAEDICYTKPLHSWFFSMGRCIPIRRGCGVYQKSMDFLLDKLNKGAWIHFFPEGRVCLTNELLRLKWGVGRLISECNIPPLVIPIAHMGMDSVLPNKTPYIPQIRKNVTMLIGNPMDFARDIELLKTLKKSPRDIRKHITDKIQEELKVLREKAQVLHAEFKT